MQSEVELCFALWFHKLQLCYPKLGKMFSDMNVLQAYSFGVVNKYF